MKWLRYKAHAEVHYGVLEDGGIRQMRGTPFGPHEPDGKKHALGDVALLPPVMPPNFYAAGINFRCLERTSQALPLNAGGEFHAIRCAEWILQDTR